MGTIDDGDEVMDVGMNATAIVMAVMALVMPFMTPVHAVHGVGHGAYDAATARGIASASGRSATSMAASAHTR